MEEQRSQEETEKIERSQAAAFLGMKGGSATHKKYGREHYVQMGKKSSKKRKPDFDQKQMTESGYIPSPSTDMQAS